MNIGGRIGKPADTQAAGRRLAEAGCTANGIMPVLGHRTRARQVAYASQFSDPDNRAHLGKARIKARLIADLDPDEWDLPPKPKWMRWSTYNRHVERYDAYEDILDRGTSALVAKLMGRSA